MGRMARVILAGLVVVALSATCLDPAYATRAGGARYKKDGERTSIEVDITAASHPQGNVYLLGPAFRSADVNFDFGSSFSGELFVCDLEDADAANDGTVDAAAGCVSVTALTGDVALTDVRASRRFLVLDVNTSEGGSTTSRLTIFGSFTVGGGGGVLGSGNLAAMTAADASAGDIWQLTESDAGTCSDTGGTAADVVMCQWNATNAGWALVGIAGAGIASVSEDGSPVLGGALDAGGFAISNAAGYIAGSATKELDYDSDSGCYYVDQDGNDAYSVEAGDRCITDRMVWSSQFSNASLDSSGEAASTRHGIQAAIDSVCTAVSSEGATIRGGIVNIPAGRYSFGANYLTIPTGCYGLVLRGQGVSSWAGGTTRATGTSLNFDLSSGADGITVATGTQHVRIENLRIQFSNQTANSRAIVFADQSDHVVVDHVFTIANSANIETGASIELTNAQNFEIKNSRLEGFGSGIILLGSDGDGGGRIHDNLIRAADTTGSGAAGIYAVGGRPFSNLDIRDNVIETGNVGVELGFSTAGNGGIAFIVGNYFENSAGTGEVNVRTTGYVAPTLVGNFFNPSTATAYRRLTGTGLSGAVDTFYGNYHLGDIVMDAGSCVVYGKTAGPGSVSACGRATVNNSAETITGAWDFGGGSLELPNSASLPGTCTIGQSYVDTDEADSARRLYLCTASNTWTQQGGSGSGSGDVTDVGNCTGSACFTADGTGGTGSILYSLSSLILELDDDQDTVPSTASVNMINGDQISMFRVYEDGVVDILDQATPTTDAVGELAIDDDGFGTGFDAIEFFNGTASAYLVAATASDPPSNGQVPTFNTGGSITWETPATGSSIFDITGAFAVSVEDLLLGGDADNTYEATEVQILDGSVYADGFIARPSAAPAAEWKDSDAADGDVSARVLIGCSTTTSGAEECDMTLGTQQAGGVTPTAAITIDSAPGTGVITLAAPNGATGNAALVVPANSIGSSEMVADTVNEDALADTITPENGTLIDFGTNVSSATEGVMLPAAATDCSVATAEGQVCWEEDDEDLYVGNGSAAVQVNGGGSSGPSCIRTNGARTLTANTNENAIFASPTNGRITLASGVYQFNAALIVTGMSATSGNASIDVLGAGTATAEDWLWQSVGVDNSSVPAVGMAATTGAIVTQDSGTTIVTAGTGSAMQVSLRGMFDVTTGGTAIPSIKLNANGTDTLASGSYFCFERIMATGADSVGAWD